MKDKDEVQKIHDLLQAVLRNEIPWPWEQSQRARDAARSALDVLCWILGHKNNQTFETNMQNAETWLTDHGINLEDLGQEIPGHILDKFNGKH